MKHLREIRVKYYPRFTKNSQIRLKDVRFGKTKRVTIPDKYLELDFDVDLVNKVFFNSTIDIESYSWNHAENELCIHTENFHESIDLLNF